MNSLILSVRNIVERLTETESRRQKLADFVREIAPDTKMTIPVTPASLDQATIAGVDGGLVKKSLHGLDCMLVRAVASCFHYSKGAVERVSYYPSRSPTPKPLVYESVSELEWNHFTSLQRLKEEVNTAIACIEKLRPQLLLLDGLLLPHFLDRPASSSSLSPLYKGLLQDYKTLFKTAVAHQVGLAGVIEDSRSSVFCDFLNTEVLANVTHELVPEMRQLLKKTRDSHLLTLILEKADRTRTFPCTNPLVSEFGIPPLRSFFLKTAVRDRPLKIDFLPETTTVDSLASLLLAISGHHDGYGLPAPLIEADQIAHLSEEEMNTFYSSLLSLTGNIPSTMQLRREQRPF